MKRTLLLSIVSSPLLAKSILPFELPQMNADGKIYKSEDHPGAVYVIESYFNGCPYCNKNAGQVKFLASEYSSNPRLQVLDVGIDSDDEEYAEWIENHSPQYPVLKDKERKISKTLGVKGVPSTHVINCKGEVLFEAIGVWDDAVGMAIWKAVDDALASPCQQGISR